MTTTTTTADKKDVQKLQRAIVDGLEDVKAIDIQVFNTEHLSPLFERVMIASGTSNRQTKALASSVRDSVRDAGFPKPRMEGEENGEWIIVDCGQAVVHIMQPAIRQYYHLEDLWGDKPVRLKFGAAKPALPSKQPVRQAVQPAAKTGGLKRSSAAKQGVELAFPSKAQEKRNAAQKVAAKKVAEKKAAPRKTPAKTALKKVLKTTAPKSAAKPATKAPAKAAAKTRKRTD
jgi:ribosome-associated protein